LNFLILGANFAQKALLKQGRQKMESLDYVTAIEIYNKILEDHDVSEAKINLAEAYRKVNDTENAEYWYGQVVRLQEAEPIHRLYYGMMLQRNGKCDMARDWFQRYVDAVPDDLRGQYLLRACDYEDELKNKNASIFEISRCDFNSNFDDFSPVFYKRGLVFSSDRDRNPIIPRKSMWTGNPFLELFYVDMRQVRGDTICGKYIYGRPEKFSKEINTKFNDASVAFANDGEEIYFTRNNYLNGHKGTDDEGIMRLKVYHGTSEGEGKWGELQSLPFNSDEYSVAHPTLTPDGNKLYFSSDMPGGFGGMDLYVSEKESGRWGPPLNLGPEVNTEGHEIFPYFAQDGRLYFASDGLIGLGGLDIYYIETKENGEWSTPENLGYPINTIADDFGIIFNEEGTCGFLSSSREGGAGGDDIYSFRKTAAAVEILVYDEKTSQPIEGATVLAECKNQSLTTNSEGKVILDMKLNDCCTFTASMEGYQDNKKEACTHDIRLSDRVMVEIPLRRVADFELEGIVFDDGTGLPLEGAIVQLENDCGATIPQAIETDISGRYYFKLDKDCCYKVKALKEGYLAGVEDNICTKGEMSSKSFKANLHLQPTIFSGEEQDLANKTNTDYTYKDLSTGLWVDKKTGLPADGVYPDGWVYDKGVLLATGDGLSNKEDTFDNGLTKKETGSPIPYLLHIYYDFDAANIRQEAIPELKKLKKMMDENSDLIVEIGSHTDARGTKPYNTRLSQRRAEAVVRWLVKRGIKRNRLVPRGYGETVPVNDCIDNIPCSELDHQFNRRTEFKIIGCVTCVDLKNSVISHQKEDVQVDECLNCPF